MSGSLVLYIYCINTIKTVASEGARQVIAAGYKAAVAAGSHRVAVLTKALRLWQRALLWA